jgi:NAD(P)H-dependent flavin oxidoreductase YrpB (nitropropane dioxygenase family)
LPLRLRPLPAGSCRSRIRIRVSQQAAFLDTLVFAAGRLADGHTVAAALATVADGAWIGTGFRAVTESREVDGMSAGRAGLA